MTSEKIDEVIEKVLNGTKLQAREYQKRIAKKTVESYFGINESKPISMIMIESPTGSGKTSMGLLIIKIMQQLIPNLHAGWVSMRRNLLTQAEKENTEKEINCENIEFISMFAHNPPPSLIAAKNAGHPVILIIDESQHDATTSMTHLHNVIKPERILGLTATPYRTDKVKLCFEKVIKDAGIHQLIQDGFLSPYDHYTISDWNVDTVVSTYCQSPEQWGKSIFYFKNLTECRKAATLLLQEGHNSEVVTGESDCEQQLDDFQVGKTNILISCMKLTEGFNEPSIKTAWVRDSVKGCTIQMGGRAFRIHTETGTKQIVQSKHTKWPMIRTALPKQQYINQNGSWLSLTINPMLSRIQINSKFAIASAPVTIPDFILRKSARKIGARRPQQ